MVFRGLICADVRSEVFQLRRNTDMSMRTIGKACGISWLLTAKVVALNIKHDSKCIVPSMYNVEFFFSQMYYFPCVH